MLSTGTLVLPGKSTLSLPLERLVLAGFITADDGNPSAVRLVGNTVVVTGTPGNDTLIGNARDDSFFARDGMIDLVFGDGGRDSADADADDVLTSVETVL